MTREKETDMNNSNHFTKHLVTALTLIILLGCTNAAVYGVSFPNYFPLDPASHGLKTFQWTYGRTGSFQSYVSGTLTVPYTSGSIEGTGIVGFSDTGYATNDGSEVQWLATDEFYISSDPELAAHPDAWTFSDVTDGMLLDQGTCYFVAHDLESYVVQEDQVLLFDIQSVTVPFGYYSGAIIIWYLDKMYPFTQLEFDGRDTDLGITLPSAERTEGYSVTGFEVYGYGIGLIASGDIDAETGSIVNLAELVVPIPVMFNIVADTITATTKSITCNIQLPSIYDVSEIDTSSIRLEDTILPTSISVRSTQQILVVKFPTSGLTLTQDEPRDLIIRGELTDGTPFVGTDSVVLVKKGGKPR